MATVEMVSHVDTVVRQPVGTGSIRCRPNIEVYMV